MLPANSAMQIEPLRLAMNASLAAARRFVATAALGTVYITVRRVGKATGSGFQPAR